MENKINLIALGSCHDKIYCGIQTWCRRKKYMRFYTRTRRQTTVLDDILRDFKIKIMGFRKEYIM